MVDARDFNAESPGKLVQTTDALGRRGLAFVPDPLPPQADFGSREIRIALSAADQELTRLDGIARQIEDPGALFSNYLRQEAVLSSAIEGTHTTLADLVMYEATHRRRTDDDPVVESYVKALRYGRERVAELSIGNRLFSELHHMLMQDSEHANTTPGLMRDCQVFVGPSTFQDARFVPPPEMFVPELMANLVEYLENENEAALIKLAVAHYQFETIHPFRDGNGRIGRLMISLWLHQQAMLTSPMLYLSAYFKRHQTQYYDALLNVSTRGAWHEWVIFFLRGVSTQSRDAWKRTQQLAKLRDDYKRRLAGPRASAGPQRLVDELFSIPTISVRMAMEILGVTYPAARSSIEKLLEAKIVEIDPAVYSGTRYFVARELIELISLPLAE